MFFFLAATIFAAAIMVSVLGQGGGALYMPIQIGFGIGFHEAAATSLFLIIAMSVSSSLVHRKAKRIDWSLAIALESASVLGSFAGGVVSGFLSNKTLLIVFALALGWASYLMMKSPPTGSVPRTNRDGWFMWNRRLGHRTYRVNMVLGTVGSSIAGLFSGLLGVGGGILKVPMMVILLGIPVDVAIGSSSLMVGLTAAGGLGGHLIHGHLNWSLALPLGAIVLLGAQLGSRISVRMDDRRLKRFAGWFLLVIALLMALRAMW